MAKSRKQIVIDGKTYQATKDRKYQNINNPKDIISRRQAEKGELAKTGAKSYEEKAKKRKAAGIPKGFRQKKLNPRSDRQYFRKKVYSIGSLKEELAKLPDNAIGLVVAIRTKHYPNITKNPGESTKAFNARKNLVLHGAITSFSDPSYLLTRYNYAKIKSRLTNQGYTVTAYEIVFTFTPAK